MTLSRNLFLNNIVDGFQNIGYFQRQLSTIIFLSLIFALFGFYIYFLKLTYQKKLNKSFVWQMILLTTAILVFSYNAFSYDLFNYIFDAKIFTHYNLNPYLHKALDFPADPMLNFMRWTHRVYPYGPFWLVLTIPLSYIGMNIFVLTFFLFKFMIAGFFLGSLYLIGKIFQKISPDKELLGVVFFGFNPLVLIESLVSAHLDIGMMFFALFAFYKLINKKYLWAFGLLVLSFEIKFASIFLMPVFFYVWYRQKNRKNVYWHQIFLSSTIFMTFAVFVTAIYSGNFQPWYLVLPLSMAVFISNRYYILIPSVIFSIFTLFMYAPYLYFGNWDKPVPETIILLQVAGVLFSAFLVVLLRLKLKTQNSKIITASRK